jgi:transcriptional regulator with XRE-family HTH domain
MTHAIRVLAETTDTVTIGRSDFEALIQAAEDAEDLIALAAHDAEEERLGRDVARRNYLTADEAERLLEGESPIKVWRNKRKLSQRALAATGGIQPGYLAEIETGKKPGSVDALHRLSVVLGVAMKDLMSRNQRMKQPDYGPVLLISTGRLPGDTANSDRSPPEAIFATNAEALQAVRKMWPTLQFQFPFIADQATRQPIYDRNELYDAMAGSPSRPIAAVDPLDGLPSA